MIDIVERLRVEAKYVFDQPEGERAMLEAADEIDRLRAELKEVQEAWYGRCVVIDERDAEIERLHAALDEQVAQ